MISLSKYISHMNEKLVICHQQVDEKLVTFPSQVNEKLVINKNYRNSSDDLNEILSKIWQVIDERKGGLIYTRISSHNAFVEAADITIAFGHKLAEIKNAIETICLLKQCNETYMIEVNGKNEFISKAFDEMINKNIELKQLEFNDMNGYAFEYDETDEFIIIVVGNDEYYDLFLGKK